MRIGFGITIIRLVPERKLILGGSRFQFEMGLAGHIPMQMIQLHSVCDAL